MTYTDENMELRAIISDLNQQAIGYVERIAALEADNSQLRAISITFGRNEQLESDNVKLKAVAEAASVFTFDRNAHFDDALAAMDKALRAAGYLKGEGE